MSGKLLGKIIELKNPSSRTNNITVVPFGIFKDEDGDLYECVIVRGNTLDNSKGVGDRMMLSLDFHSPLIDEKIIELS